MSTEMICSSCKKPITSTNNAIVEWYTHNDTNVQEGFRISHINEICQYDFSELRTEGKTLNDLNYSNAKYRLIELLTVDKVNHAQVEAVLNQLN